MITSWSHSCGWDPIYLSLIRVRSIGNGANGIGIRSSLQKTAQQLYSLRHYRAIENVGFLEQVCYHSSRDWSTRARFSYVQDKMGSSWHLGSILALECVRPKIKGSTRKGIIRCAIRPGPTAQWAWGHSLYKYNDIFIKKIKSVSPIITNLSYQITLTLSICW